MQREKGVWVVYELGLGKCVRLNDIVLPPDPEMAELAMFLNDFFHELSGPGDRIEPVD